MHISWTYLELFNSGLQCELLLEAVVEKWTDVSLQAERYMLGIMLSSVLVGLMEAIRTKEKTGMPDMLAHSMLS